MNPKYAQGNPWQNTATHATAATFTVTGVAGKTHYLSDLAVSSDKAGAIVLVKDGTTVIFQAQVDADFFEHVFAVPLKATAGADLVVSIDGTSACKVNATGVTIG